MCRVIDFQKECSLLYLNNVYQLYENPNQLTIDLARTERQTAIINAFQLVWKLRKKTHIVVAAVSNAPL